MYCPTCRYEYREGFYVCSDCNLDLVVKLEEKPHEIIKPSLAVYKASLKRFWISLGIATGLFGMLLLYKTISKTYYNLYYALSDAYYDLIFDYKIFPPDDKQLYEELFEKLSRLNVCIDFIIISCVSSLLIYAAYKGFRYIRPFGGVAVFAGLSVIAGLALTASAYTIVYVSYFWPRLLMALLSVCGYA